MPSAVSSQGSTCGRKRRSHERCASISRCKMEGPLGCFSQGRVTPPLPAGPRVERNRSASLAKALKRREGSWPSANGCHRSPTPQQPSHSPRSSQSSFEGQEPARCGLRGGTRTGPSPNARLTTGRPGWMPCLDHGTDRPFNPFARGVVPTCLKRGSHCHSLRPFRSQAADRTCSHKLPLFFGKLPSL